MKIRAVLITLTLGVILTTCQHGSAIPEAAPEPASAVSVDAPMPQKESPFVQRTFSPFLAEVWIGDAISYGCYREGQAPGVKGPSESEILEDLNILQANWNLVRVYGADDDTERILKVIHENDLPIKVLLGIWLENETKRPEREVENMEQVQRGIKLANQYRDIVIAVNVGNETQVYWSWHRMEAKSLIKYIRTVRAGIEQPVTTADDYNFWNKPDSKTIASELDFIGLHAYPLWNGITLEKSMTWLDSVYRSAQQFHNDREIIISETGWATVYQPKNDGPGQEGALVKTEVSIPAQEVFLSQFIPWSRSNKITTFLFEAFDEPWKGGGLDSDPDVMEKHWGVYFEDRTPKESISNLKIKQIIE